MVAVIFCTETSRHVNYSVSNQHWTSGVAAIWTFWIYPGAAESEGAGKVGLK